MKRISVFVPGLPVAQPRSRAVSFGGHARMYNPGTANQWKACVIHALQGHAGTFPKDIPLRCDITFYLPRPAGHYGSGKNTGKLKVNAPTRPTGKPDRDNLDKAVCDAITAACVWHDDSQVTDGRIRKRYNEVFGYRSRTGCYIDIAEDVE